MQTSEKILAPKKSISLPPKEIMTGEQPLLIAVPPVQIDPLNNVFIPDWYNRPAQVPGVLSLGDTEILSHQNLTSVIAKPGQGKSSIIEAIEGSFSKSRL